MNKRIKKLWIKALTSGEYQQGKEQLRDGDKFCCLGVLCDLYSKETGTQWEGETFLGRDEVLPEPVWSWAGLEGGDPVLPSRFKQASLAAQNDSGSSFGRIADLIERYF